MKEAIDWIIGLITIGGTAIAGVLFRHAQSMAKLEQRVHELENQQAEIKKAMDEKFKELGVKVDNTASQNQLIIGKLDIIQNYVLKGK